MERDDIGLESTYEEDAMGVPDHTTSEPERDPIPVDQQMPPGEHPRGADAWGTTATEQRAGKPLSDRLDEEQPDRPLERDDDGLRLVDDGEPDRRGELTSSGDPGDDEGETAEERAVHVRPDAPGGTSGPDAYLEDEDADGDGARGAG